MGMGDTGEKLTNMPMGVCLIPEFWQLIFLKPFTGSDVQRFPALGGIFDRVHRKPVCRDSGLSAVTSAQAGLISCFVSSERSCTEVQSEVYLVLDQA
ncbi:MAG: hypothetical protein V3W43_14480 [Desulfatiglandaceae bacterium]